MILSSLVNHGLSRVISRHCSLPVNDVGLTDHGIVVELTFSNIDHARLSHFGEDFQLP